MTFPVVLHFGEEIYGTPGDATGGVTQYWWWGYAILHGGSIFDNKLEGVPLGSGWSEIPFVVLPLVIFTPLTLAIGPIASYNLLILSSFPLTAWATFLLIRRLGFSAIPSSFGALAFAFSPYHIGKATGHGNEAHMEFVALMLYFLVGWRQTGRRRDVVLAGVMAGLQLWMDYSVLFVMAFGVLAFFIVSAVLKPDDSTIGRWLWRNIKAGVATAVVAIPFVPVALVAFHRPGSGSLGVELGGAHRSIDELQIYSARLYEYFEPWHDNPLVPAVVKHWEDLHLHGSNYVESSLTLGYVVMLLALVGLLMNRQKFPAALGIGLVVIGVVMASAPTTHVLGISFHAPSYYLYSFLTIFRVYARFGILVLLGVCILAAAGLAGVERRVAPGPSQALLVLPFLLLAFEFNNIPPFHVTKILPAPAEYTWLRDQPPGILMEYPAHSGDPLRQEIEVRQYELYQMVHLHPTFLNESPTTGVVADAAAQLEPYYNPGVAAQLKAYGVRYVFVHRDDYAANGWSLPMNIEGLTYETTFDGVDIYVVA